MKTLMKYTISILCMLSLVACGSRDNHISLDKEGAKYTIGKEVSFYYPNGYDLDTSKNIEKQVHADIDTATPDNTLYFMNNDETIFYKFIQDETDNTLEEKEVLYTGKLEQDGATNIVVSKPILESGNTVCEISASYVNTGTRTKQIVYFSQNAMYVYGYLATTDDYNENVDFITEFLKSIVINESTIS